MIKNFLRVLSSNGAVALVGLVSSLMLPGILSIEDYAIYQTFYLYLSYIAIFSLGFPSGMVIKYAGRKREEIEKEQYKAEIRLLILILICFTIIGFLLSLRKQSRMLLLISAMIFPYCYLRSHQNLLQAWQKFREYAVLHVLLSAVPMLFPIITYFFIGKVTAGFCIACYIATYSILCILYLVQHCKLLKNITCASLFTKENWNTEKVGFFFLLGNYINSLFHSVDKQFIKWFGTVPEFSFYSFAITMQSVMTIFITAISLPLFPYMAAKKGEGKDYIKIRRMLLMLGSASGLAYFACCGIIQCFLPDYQESLEIIRIYFAVFPAMAVINCLYFNLYKIRKMTMRYTIDLIAVFICSIIGNVIGVKLGGSIGVALATTVIYYIWLAYGMFVFPELRMGKRDVLFLVGFFVLFGVIPGIGSLIGGFVLYCFADIVWCVVCFPTEIKTTLRGVFQIRKG